MCDRALPGTRSSMTEDEKSDLSLFGPEARQRAAVAARCSVAEVMPANGPLLATIRLVFGSLNIR